MNHLPICIRKLDFQSSTGIKRPFECDDCPAMLFNNYNWTHCGHRRGWGHEHTAHLTTGHVKNMGRQTQLQLVNKHCTLARIILYYMHCYQQLHTSEAAQRLTTHHINVPGKIAFLVLHYKVCTFIRWERDSMRKKAPRVKALSK